MGFSTFIGQETAALYVPRTAGSPIPIPMPTGIQAGDYLVAFLENYQVNPVDVVGPPGWAGTLSTGFFIKLADGSEDGATLNWTTRSTGALDPSQRVIVAAVLCYRFSLQPSSVDRQFQSFSALADSVTLSDIPGTGGSAGTVTNTQLRVYCAFGQRADGQFDSTLVHPLTDITWSNPIDRTGLVSLPWAGGTAIDLNDGTALSAADVEYNFGPPFVGYNPHDSVTAFGGSFSTAARLHVAVFNIPGFLETAAYWGIDAGTA